MYFKKQLVILLPLHIGQGESGIQFFFVHLRGIFLNGSCNDKIICRILITKHKLLNLKVQLQKLILILRIEREKSKIQGRNQCSQRSWLDSWWTCISRRAESWITRNKKECSSMRSNVASATNRRVEGAILHILPCYWTWPCLGTSQREVEGAKILKMGISQIPDLPKLLWSWNRSLSIHHGFCFEYNKRHLILLLHWRC